MSDYNDIEEVNFDTPGEPTLNSDSTETATNKESSSSTTTATGTSTESFEVNMEKKDGVLYLGIDLGTSRTSVTASNGVRETVASFVGYPKDVVAKKLLKKDVLFGSEAIEKRLSLNLYRPLGEGVLKCSQEGSDEGDDYEGNLRAAKDLIGEIIRLSKPRKDELVYAVIGCPAEASINNREAIIDAARQTVDSVMLCSEPFSVAYGLEMLDDVLVIDIGAGTTDLCRMHGTMPDESDQVTLNFAGDTIDKELWRLLEERYPEAQFSMHMIKSIKEKYGAVGELLDSAVVELPVNGKPTPFDITNEIREACQVIINPIVKGLGELIGSFDPEFQHKLKDRVLLAGGGSQIKGLDKAIEAEMNRILGSGHVIRVEEPMYGGANGALKIAHDMPAEYWEQLK
ncbi:MAG: rod shape-determining protein MreB [Planctomycetota bacterium]|jgi:rod shape-determining protein MreB